MRSAPYSFSCCTERGQCFFNRLPPENNAVSFTRMLFIQIAPENPRQIVFPAWQARADG